MKKFTLVILTIAVVAVGAVLVFAQTTDKPGDGKKGFGKRGMHAKHGMRGKRGGRRGHRGGHMFRGLDLTDAQKTQIQAIMKTGREDGKALRTQIRSSRQEFGKIENPSDMQIQSFASGQGELHAKMIVQKQKVKAQMFGVLTSEQKAKLAEMKAERKKKMEERKARWAEKRGGKTDQ